MAVKSVKVEKKRLTVAEQRDLLEKQMADLEILEQIEDEINGLIKRYQEWYDGECKVSYEDGLEDEQAKNYNGELLYKYKEPDGYSRTLTEKEIRDKGYDFEKAEPYFRIKYRTETRELDDLSTWSRTRAIAYKRLIKFFENLDITEIGEE